MNHSRTSMHLEASAVKGIPAAATNGKPTNQPRREASRARRRGPKPDQPGSDQIAGAIFKVGEGYHELSRTVSQLGLTERAVSPWVTTTEADRLLDDGSEPRGGERRERMDTGYRLLRRSVTADWRSTGTCSV